LKCFERNVWWVVALMAISVGGSCAAVAGFGWKILGLALTAVGSLMVARLRQLDRAAWWRELVEGQTTKDLGHSVPKEAVLMRVPKHQDPWGPS